MEVKNRGRKWDINDARVQWVQKFMMEMIALHNQPFSLLQDIGFVTEDQRNNHFDFLLIWLVHMRIYNISI